MLETIKRTDQDIIDTIPVAKPAKDIKISKTDKKKISDILTRYQDM